MSLNYSANIIADTRVAYVAGVKALGSCTLKINVEFRQPAWGHTIERASASVQFGMLSLQGDSGTGGELGRAYPDQPLLLTSGPHSITSHQTFSVALSESQMFAIEGARKGGGVRLKLNLVASGNGQYGDQVIQDDVAYAVSPSEWARILRELGHGDLIVLGVPLPIGKEAAQLRSAIDLLHMANRHLVNGEYDAVISRCRQAIESAQKVLNDGEATREAISVYKRDRQSMTTLQREQMIREVIRHYANPAHHVDGEGDTECYGRADATFLIALAAAAVTRASARTEVHQLGLDDQSA
ncbi:hypothetical protein [Burkholderia pseudomallei]